MDRHALNASKYCALEAHKHKHVRKYINKSYAFVRNERYGEFLRMLGAEKTAESRAIVARPTVVLREQNGEYTWKAVYPILKKTFMMKFRLGEPIEKQLSNGTRVVTRFEIDKNEVIETQDFDDGRTIIVTRQFEDDELIIIMEMGNFRSHRFFVAGDSKHTICTETSRRQSFVEKREEKKPSPAKSPSSSLFSLQSYVPEEETTGDSDEICL